MTELHKHDVVLLNDNTNNHIIIILMELVLFEESKSENDWEWSKKKIIVEKAKGWIKDWVNNKNE